ncbi:MAG: 1-phosphatidylinositol phosphodiesterase [Solirubrobacteraceae bacterium]|nr:1-phosphatidylinositol phosphodiesterase [Solirubrobacteraceae bacterium]
MGPVPLPDWMAAVDGRRPLSELAIPGTHDSAARHGRLRSRTQTMDVPAQLDAGIRFLDIRLRDVAGAFRAYHGRVDERAEFEADILDPVRGFLARHPGESVIMSIKQEDRVDPAGFARDFERLVARHPGTFHPGPWLPDLAAARARIVVLRRFAGPGVGIPAPPELWPNRATFRIATPHGILDVEDEWEVPGPLPAQMNAKWAAVARHLDAAAAASGSWDLTFASGTGDFVHPRAIAAGMRFVPGINQRLLDYLSAHGRPRRLGTLVMDFPELPDGRLIRSIVEANHPAPADVDSPAKPDKLLP